MAKINVKETEIAIINNSENDYISITDIAKYKTDNPSAAIGNWMRNRNTIEFLGLWEIIHNPNFWRKISCLCTSDFRSGSTTKKITKFAATRKVVCLLQTIWTSIN